MARSIRELYRARVFSAKGKYVGRAIAVLFHSADPVVVGFVVERPRLLFILDLKDRYLALDRARIGEREIFVDQPADAWDKKAAKRLGLDWDTTVVWYGMPVKTERGRELGTVRDGLFDAETGRLEALGLSSGAAADVTVGVRDLPARLVRGYSEGRVLVAEEAAALETTGGAAAAAGKGAAVAKDTVSRATKTAVAYGKAAAKVASQSETGKKAVGWLRAMKDELADAMGDPDDDK